MKVSSQERGWIGHFICADACLFRRNTLLDNGRDRIVISTVGNHIVAGKPSQMGASNGCFFETKVFASLHDKWDDVNVRCELDGRRWHTDDDFEANSFHENVVSEWQTKMGEIEFMMPTGD